MKVHSVPLREVIAGQILYGIKTGLNDAFVIDEQISRKLSLNTRTRSVIKKFIAGKDIQRWKVQPNRKFLLYLYHGIETQGLEKVLEHLRPLRTKLEGRATDQEWYELQQPQQVYAEAFDRPKIVYPDIAKFPRFALDESGAYVDCTAFALPTNDLYLLGVLNSFAVQKYFQQVGAVVRGGYLRFKRQYVEEIPIPNAPEHERRRVIDLVRRCLDASDVERPTLEEKINKVVARLYGLEPNEIDTEAGMGTNPGMTAVAKGV